MAKLAALQIVLDELNEKFPRPGISKLEISPLHDLDSKWAEQYPSADQPGVYILLDDAEEVAYIGKASFNHNLGGRLGAHFGYGPNRTGYATRLKKWRNERLRYIVVIPLKKEHAFEASAIEEFLLSRLRPQPRLNIVGIGKTAPCLVATALDEQTNADVLRR
jgi:excinuclease UvrABC nuclease subunit